MLRRGVGVVGWRVSSSSLLGFGGGAFRFVAVVVEGEERGRLGRDGIYIGSAGELV